MTIAQRLSAIRTRMDAACVAAGRDPADVQLIAVSKTKPDAMILEALAAGHTAFGENYAQELRDKAQSIQDPRVEWHFIGHLQRNKVRYVAGRAALIHAVGSVRLAKEIDKRSAGPQPVLIEVNVGGEASKSGVPADQALALCAELADLEHVRVQGLMTIPPAGGDPGPWFAQLADLAEQGRAQGFDLRHLSMGMSGDFETAIAHGATLVRVGSAIFGARG
jgi:pyridoxal phosphate enzyme (YggS family)